MVYFLVLVVFVKVLVVFSEIGVVLVVFGSGGSETLNPTLERKNFGGRSLGVGQLGRPRERKKKETKLRVVCARSTRLLDAHCIGASLSIEASVAYIHADCSFELLSHHLESSMYRMLEPRKRLKGIS